MARPRWHSVAVVAGLGLCSATIGAAAGPPPPTAPRVVSLDPVSGTGLGDCGYDFPAPLGLIAGDAHPKDTAVEPRIAIDPRDPRRMATAWMQDFAGSVVVASTVDGGRSWRRSVPPRVSSCTGSDGAAFDPGLAYDSRGSLYLSMMSHLVLMPGRTQPENDVSVSRSDDGGRSWGDPVVVVSRDPLALNDYPTITAAVDEPGHVAVSWTRVSEPLGNNSLGQFVSTSRDGGRTFSPPVRAYDAGRPFFQLLGILTAAPRRALSLVLTVYDSGNSLPAYVEAPSRVVEVRSFDSGRTWSAPATVRDYVPAGSSADPSSGEQVRDGTLSVAAGRDGSVTAAWLTGDAAGGPNRLAMARRTGGSARWSALAAPAVPPGTQVLLPTVAANARNDLGLVWYDTRQDVPGDDAFTATAWFGVLRPGTSSWRTTAVAGPVDLRGAYADARDFFPGSVSRFLGDYVGLVGNPDGFRAALPLPRPIARLGASQLFVAAIRTAPRGHGSQRGEGR
ncbi:MAG: glycoside hydrolase [Actinomycetota bacterium]|nr:glycoside hydrolase [Actinomycetota bacterium]